MPAFARAILLAAVAASLVVHGGTGARAADLPDRLAGNARLSKFYQLINRAGLIGWLHSNSGLTVFAPTNRAFAVAPASIRAVIRPRRGADLRALRVRLQQLVRGHVLTVTLPPSVLIGQRRTFTAADGAQRIIDGTEAGVIAISAVPSAGPARTGVAKRPSRPAYVFGRTIAADNGIIYPIDRVLAD